MAKFCQNCGGKLTEGAKFCISCGTPVPIPTQAREAIVQNTQPLQAVETEKPEIDIVAKKPETDIVKEDDIEVKALQVAESEVDTALQAAESEIVQAVEGEPVVASEATESKPVEVVKTKAKQAVDAVKSKASNEAKNAVKSSLSDLSEQLASSDAGETVLGTLDSASGVITQLGEILGPFKTVVQSIKGVYTGVVGIFKNKEWKKLIIAAVFALVWIVLLILSHFGIGLSLLDWLTFAKGGVNSSTIIGGIGGLLGKTAVVSMVYSLVGGGLGSLGNGIKELFNGENFKTKNLSVLLFGAGGALILYQCFAGSAHWTDTMSALSGGVLSVMALGGSGGFISRMAQSLTAKVSNKVRIPQSEKANVLLCGMTYGFTLGALASLVPFGWMPLILGCACIIAGFGMIIGSGNKDKKEVQA